MTGRRDSSSAARLARAGFSDPDKAATALESLTRHGVGDEDMVSALALTADPDAALMSLDGLAGRLTEPAELRSTFTADSGARDRLLAVLGASPALAEHLLRHPEDWRAAADARLQPPSVLRGRLLEAVHAEAGDLPRAGLPVPAAMDALRVAYRRVLIDIAARDLTGVVRVDDVAAELADLAAATLEAALAVARAELPRGAPECRLAVIAMGKCGGRELNYVSDVDVVFVAEAADDVDEATALRTASLLATAMMRVCSASTGEGTIWPVDAALRPEGKAGPLVRTLASHVAYYQRWAKTWEFQALLKARPVAGDLELGWRYVESLSPLVWDAAGREDFVVDVQQMRRRVESTVPADARSRQLKLGPGGLRDVEFAVQMLQLVHGRTDHRLRSPNTLEALEALSTHGYVGRDDAAELDRAYRFLRTLEHRLQLHRLRRTHVMPDDEVELRRLGRSIGLRTSPVEELDEQWRLHAREVRRLHEKLFYRPLLTSVARLGPEQARLTPAAAHARLDALGYLD
ncbi:MAG: bifunctional [glutamine synthetase] adenylyltransferase/[glutamine synthetase]-adenylyl-L-tyrosine phosphorylase, partial [Sporichthyaceae bacterium]